MARSRWLVAPVVVAALLSGCGGGGGSNPPPPTTRTLTVTVAGTGGGTVTSSPAGISCSSGTCSATFAQDTAVTLTATATGASTFAGWSGGGCGGTGTCPVVMGSDVSVTATFDAPPAVTHTLWVTVSGGGSGTVTSSPSGLSCSAGTCSHAFGEGTVVTLTSTPTDEYSVFAAYGGACTGSTCSVTMTGDVVLQAQFDAVMPKRTVTVGVTGGGTVTSSPSGISCPGSCTSSFDRGGPPPAALNTVTLTPAANTGWQFSGWGGACSGSGGCIVTLDTDKNVTATFTADPGQSLTVNVVGDGVGTVTSSPAGISCTTGSSTGCSASFPTGTNVTLTGTAAAGSTFNGWAPTCDATPDPCTFSIGSATSLTAKFAAWTVRRPFPGSVKGVAALGTTLIAVGSGGRIATSTDGLAWTGRELPTGATLRGVAADAGGTTAVAVGDGGAILTTGNATAWMARTSGVATPLNAVVHGGGTYVAVGATGTIVSSGDGASWVTRTSGTPYDLLSVAYGSSAFVAVGYGGTVLTSTNGQDWTQVADGITTQPLTGVAYDSGSGFVAVGGTGHVLTSSNGSSWTLQAATLPVGLSVVVRGVAASAGVFAAVDTSDAVHRSTTGGTSWTTSAAAEDLQGSAVAGMSAAGGAFYALADGGMSRSTDGAAWTRVLTLNAVLYGLAYGNSTYVLVGHGVILTSPDGAVWTSRYAGNPYLRATDMVSAVVFANSTFIAVSGHGILSSADGASWTTVGTAPSMYGGVIAWGGSTKGFVVASTDSGASGIWTSPDGTASSWTQQTGAGLTMPVYGIVYGGSTFVAVGGSASGSAIYSNSSPGTTAAWTQQNPPAGWTHTLSSVAYGNSTFVASDSQSGQDAITSTNAVTWLGPNHAPAFMGRVIAFGAGVFLSERMLTSADGATWTPDPYPPLGINQSFAATHDGPQGWVVASAGAPYTIAVHP